MGAIFGIVGDASVSELEKMRDRLRHRGVYCAARRIGPSVFLGACSDTPGTCIVETESFALAADASIFNVDELAALIESMGGHIGSTSASALIAAAYAALGTECFPAVNGDFAVAIWDKRRNVLILARDMMAYRPLHYWQGDGRTIFASEYKAILALDDVPAVPDIDAIQHLMYTKFPPTNRTLMTGICSGPASHFLEFAAGAPRSTRYWHPASHIRPASKEDYAIRIRKELLRAVERRTSDQEEVGIALSSGIDSAAIVAAARNADPDKPIHTFTAGYGSDDPEILGAEQIARHFSTIHHPVHTDPAKLPELLPEIVWHLEDPIARSEVVLNHEAARVAQGTVSAVLIGYGADTLFAGMPRHKIINLMDRLPFAQSALGEFYTYTQVNLEPRSPGGRLLHWLYYRGGAPPVPSVSGATLAPAASNFPEPGDEFVNRFLVAGLLPGSRAAAKFERLQMKYGIESRAPYFDPQLTTAAFTIPSHQKIRGMKDKIIFRRALDPWLPPSAVRRPKFPGRMNSDLAFSRALQDFAAEVLSPYEVTHRGFFNPIEMDRLLLRGHNRPYEYEHAMRIWSAIMVELWARAFVDRRGASNEEVSTLNGMLPAPVPRIISSPATNSGGVVKAAEKDGS